MRVSTSLHSSKRTCYTHPFSSIWLRNGMWTEQVVMVNSKLSPGGLRWRERVLTTFFGCFIEKSHAFNVFVVWYGAILVVEVIYLI